MFVQILIYVYLGICAGMILFNIATALLSRRREHRSFRDGIRLELTVSRELDRLAETGAVSERHLRFMERRLRRVNGMAAFDAALERLCVRRPELTRSYLTALNGVTITLAEDYCRRDEIEAAYFPYIIRKYRLLDGQENEALKTMLLDLLHESSIYCRENAMQALYTAGDAQIIVRALRIIDASSLSYNPKLLADGLLNFNGDETQLAEALWAAFEDFKVWAIQNSLHPTVIAFLGFRPDLLSQEAPKESETNPAFATPRSWTMLSKLAKTSGNIEAYPSLVYGSVGYGAGVEFLSYLKTYSDIPDIDAVLRGEDVEPPTNPGALYALTAALVERFDRSDKEGEVLLAFSKKLPVEFGVMLIKDLVVKHEDLALLPSFEEWLNIYGGYIL